MLEFCRRCRDTHERHREAEVIVWGKLFPDETLGPRCLDCLAEQLPSVSIPQLDGYAIFDLRDITRGLSEIGEAEFGVSLQNRDLPHLAPSEQRSTVKLAETINQHSGKNPREADSRHILAACSWRARRLLKLP